MSATVLLSTLLLAQAPPPPNLAVHREAMNKLAFLAGRWEGSGWMQRGPGARREYSQTETVQFKQDGVLLLIEGLGKDRESGRTVHDALAIVTFDEASRTYRVRAFAGPGRFVDTEAKVFENGLEWGFKSGPVTVRYTLRIDENGAWREDGDSSMDGKTWTRFLEMTVKRVGP